MISIGQSDEEFIKYAKRHKIPDLDMLFHLVKNNTHAGIGGSFSEVNMGVIRLLNYPETPEDFGILVHEIFHCVSMILRDLGFKLKDASDEAYAYLIGYLTKKVYECF